MFSACQPEANRWNKALRELKEESFLKDCLNLNGMMFFSKNIFFIEKNGKCCQFNTNPENQSLLCSKTAFKFK